MNKIIKIGCVIFLITFLFFLLLHVTYINSFDDVDNDTLIISVCTGNMRGLEMGISVYAGYKQVPLLLSDKELPEQLSSWLPDYVREKHIKKIIVVGPISAQENMNLYKTGVIVQHIDGDSIPDILTKIADNTHDKNNNTLIFTDSQPVAAELGAYTKTPVFITANNSTYESSKTLDENYVKYIETHDIKHIIIVGSLPTSLKNQLKSFDNITVEEINGHDSVDLSINVNNKLKTMGYLKNTHTVYYGFYGELSTVIPSVIRNNASLIEDSSGNNCNIQYLKDNNISTVYITRNKESDYIQMEEPDYISSNIVKQLNENNISIKYFTRSRTLDEATGLYDMRIISAEFKDNYNDNNKEIFIKNKNIENDPPLLSILNYSDWKDSNNLSIHITSGDNNYTVKWNTIHPYTWIKLNNNTYYATSNTGYTYYWKHHDNVWSVDYRYNNSTYYNVEWIQNDDNSWTEVQKNNNFTWFFNGSKWACYDADNNMVYSIEQSN